MTCELPPLDRLRVLLEHGLREQYDLASGLSNTTQQIGGALGTAIMSTLAITRTEDLLASGTAQGQALTEGFQLALYASVGLAVVGALAVLALVRPQRSQEVQAGRRLAVRVHPRSDGLPRPGDDARGRSGAVQSACGSRVRSRFVRG